MQRNDGSVFIHFLGSLGASLAAAWILGSLGKSVFSIGARTFRSSDFINPGAVADIAARRPAGEDDFILAAWELVGGGIDYQAFGSDVEFNNGVVRCDKCYLPGQVRKTGASNCVGKSALLASILRNRLPADRVFMVIGELHLDGVGGHAWCCPAGTIITGVGDLKTIESIQAGDTILSCDSRISHVKAPMQRLYSGQILSIKRQGYTALPLQITPEHPIWTLQGWVPAGRLRVGDFIGEPILTETVDREIWTREIRYITQTGVRTSPFRKKRLGTPYERTRKFSYSVPINSETLRLAGYYLSEGVLQECKRLNKRTPAAKVVFYFNKKEIAYIEDICSLVYKYFRTKVHISYPRQDALARLETKSRGLFEFLLQFGRGASQKEIPQWVLLLPQEKQAGLIVGYFRGDGCVSKNAIIASSSSLRLIEDIRLMLARHRILGSLYSDKADARNGRLGTYGNSHNQYRLEVMGDHARELAKVLGVSYLTKPRRYPLHSRPAILGNMAYYPVKSIDRQVAEELPVFNLSVSGNESYVANGCCVHNCEVVRNGIQYIVESTSPPGRNPWTPAAAMPYYTPGAYLNDQYFSCAEPKLCVTVASGCPCNFLPS